MLKLKNVQKSFSSLKKNEEVNILTNLNFELNNGKTVAILGKSGSGKSTLLSLIAGLDSPTSGEIIIDDIDITQLKQKALSNFRALKIAIIFQQFHLIPHLNALENVDLPLQLTGKKTKHTPQDTLAAVGLKDRFLHYPSQLSGGEQQRVAIARALVMEPSLLLADEPTGNLDDLTSQEVSQYLFKTIKELHLSLLVVTHDEEIATHCEKKYYLQNGNLKAIH